MRKIIKRIALLFLVMLQACALHPATNDSATATHNGSSLHTKSSANKAQTKPTQGWDAPEFKTAESNGHKGSCSANEIPSFDYRRLQSCIDSLLNAGQVDSAAVLLGMQIHPRNNLNELGRRSMQLARIMHSKGHDKEAMDVLESFLALKPVVGEWMDSVTVYERVIQRAQAKQAVETTPLVKQIANLMATKADYGLVHELTDSLRTQTIPDSLRHWSLVQDSIAMQRNLAKYRIQIEEMKRQVLDAAQYDAAHAFVKNLRELGPEAAKSLAVDSLEAWIKVTETNDAKDRDPTYWKTHDPATVLKNARHLRDSGRQEDALALLRKLLQTTLRKEARADLNGLGELFCTKQRQVAADNYSKARKVKQPEQAQKLIELAVAALDLCVVQFPETPQHPKILQNRDLLMQELAKRKGNE